MTTPAATPAKPAAAKVFTPWIYSNKGFRAAIIEHLKAFKPEGTPDPAQIDAAKTFVISQVNALSDELNFAQVNIDASVNPRARQTNVIVIGETVLA